MGTLPTKKLNPAISFDYIIDTDIGLIRYIQENYRDETKFNIDVLNKSDRDILSLLYNRLNLNPLSIIMKDLLNADLLYESFFTYYKKEIIKKSYIDESAYNFVKLLCKKSYGIVPNIIIRDDAEKETINKYFKGCYLINYKDKKALSSKDPFYLKDYKILTESGIDSLNGKYIYTTGRKYNLEFFKNEGKRYLFGAEPIIVGKDI